MSLAVLLALVVFVLLHSLVLSGAVFASFAELPMPRSSLSSSAVVGSLSVVGTESVSGDMKLDLASSSSITRFLPLSSSRCFIYGFSLGQTNPIRSRLSRSLARTLDGFERFSESFPTDSPTSHISQPPLPFTNTRCFITGTLLLPSVSSKTCNKSGHISAWAWPNLTVYFAGPVLLRFHTVGPPLIRFSHRQQLPLSHALVTPLLIRFSHRKRLPRPSPIRFSNRQKLPSPSASHRSKFSVDSLGLFVKIVTVTPLLGMSLTTIPLSLRGGFIPRLVPGNPKNVFTDMFSCVAVCLGPEESYDFVSTNIGGRGSSAKSLVTKSRLSCFAVKVMTHLSSVSNPLSICQDDDLSALGFIVLNLCCNDLRGCLISSLKFNLRKNVTKKIK